jgi:hypothetical protein
MTPAQRLVLFSGGAPVVVIAKPTILWQTDATDNTPTFLLEGEVVVNDTIRFQFSQQNDFSSGVTEVTNTVDSDEDAANEVDYTLGSPLADGTWYARAHIERTGASPSPWSDAVSQTISSVNIATLNWVNAVVTAGGTVSDTQKAVVDALIVGLKADGLWSTDGALDHLWLLAGELVAKQAAIDIVGLLSNTAHGTPAAFDKWGYTGSVAGAFYIDPGFANDASGDNFGQNSAEMGAYISTLPTVGQVLGDFSAGEFNLQLGSTFCRGAIAHNVAIASFAMTPGLYIVDLSATAIGVYKNGSTELATNTLSTQTFDPSNIFAFARDVGSADSISNGRVGMIFTGGHMTSTQQDAFYARVQTYMTAWGAQV